MRIDKYLAENGYAKSREAAQEMLKSGLVSADGKIVKKPSAAIDESVGHEICLLGETLRYVSRGGLKLERALEAFGLDVHGLNAVDIGASTGGFTDCLLQHGAASVRAVDVGRSQLDPSLEADPRVVSFEGINARYLKPEDIGGRCDLVVCDVSFISLSHIFGPAAGLLFEDGRMVTLIKPQFEAGRAHIGKGGIVRDRQVHAAVIEQVLESAASQGLCCFGLDVSPIEGGDGNREYLAAFSRHASGYRPDIGAVVFHNH